MTDITPYQGGALAPVQSSAELATSAAAAQMTAMVQAQYMVAIQRPRNADGVWLRLTADCNRPDFADEAMWSKPVGRETIQGLSVRFAERARQVMGNVRSSRMTLFDDATRRIVRVTIIDLETNATEEREVTVTKQVERRKLRQGQQPLGTRVNTYGQTVYIVAATDDEVSVREGALCAKAERDCTLKLLDPALKAEAMALIRQTLANGGGDDPAEARRKLVAAFATVGISPEDLVGHLGHGLEKCTAPQVADLRMLFTSLRDGETTWATVIGRDDEAPAKETKTSKVKAELEARRTKAEPGADG